MKYLIISLFFSVPAFAALNPAETNEFGINYSHSSLSDHSPEWNDVNFTAVVHLNNENYLNAEIDSKSHFGEKGALASASLTHDYSENWYQNFSATISSNSHILPANVLFSEINRKITAEKKIVLGLGAGHITGQTPYQDWFGLLEATFYYIPSFTIQTGLRFNRSNPNSVDTVRLNAAFTYTLNEKIELSYRFDGGREGYSVIAADSFTNLTSSTDQILQVRYFPVEKWGVLAGAEYYHGSFYSRAAMFVGLLYR